MASILKNSRKLFSLLFFSLLLNITFCTLWWYSSSRLHDFLGLYFHFHLGFLSYPLFRYAKYIFFTLCFQRPIAFYPFLSFFCFFFKIFFFLILREKGKEGERGVKYQLVASPTPPTGDPACNLGMRPDQVWNQQPFSSLAGAQTTKLHLPGAFISFSLIFFFLNGSTHIHYQDHWLRSGRYPYWRWATLPGW